MCLQIPGGWLADRLGGKWLYGGCILLSSVISLLTPTAARIHINLVILLRALSGLGEGVLMPAAHVLLARWSIPKYRSLIVSAVYSGVDTGSVVGLLLSGFLCDHDFAGGWPSVFYVFGAAGCVWSVAWFLLCYNTPLEHPRISTAECEYWERITENRDLAAHPPAPWRKILTSLPVWALTIAYFAEEWGYYIVVTCIPMFIHDILGFNMLQNGVISGLPFVVPCVLVSLTGLLMDWLRSPGRLSTNVVRKLFCVAGFTVTASSFVFLSYVGCDRAVATLALFIAVGGSALSSPVFTVNILDLAPLHAGKLMGLVFVVVNLAAVGAPLSVGALTSDASTRTEWRTVFYMSAAIYAVGAVVFVIFGSGNRQSWEEVTGDVQQGEVDEVTSSSHPVGSVEQTQL